MHSHRAVCDICGCTATTNIMGEPVCDACKADFVEWRERKYAQANGAWPRCTMDHADPLDLLEELPDD